MKTSQNMMMAAALKVLFVIPLATALEAATFTSTGPFPLGDSPDLQSIQQPATNPYPLTLSVSGLSGATTSVSLGIVLTHTFPDDLNFLLVSPTGQTLQVMSNAGGSANVSNCAINFSDVSGGLPPDSGIALICNQTYLPGAAYTTTPLEPYAAPAPAGPYGTAFSVFQGFNPNGNWSLYIGDAHFEDTGSLASWSLSINTSPVPEPSSLGLAVAGMGAMFAWKRRRGH